MMQFSIGDSVEATVMSVDSFYKKIRGTITAMPRNGWVNINATQVIDKWSTDWAKHPTSCATGAKTQNLIAWNGV